MFAASGTVRVAALYGAAAFSCLFALPCCGADAPRRSSADEQWAEPTLRPSVTVRPIPRENFAERLADAFCSALDDCCTAASFGSAASDCHSAMQSNYERELAMFSELAVEYDPWLAGRCIELATPRLAGCTYAGLNLHSEVCRRAFQGTMPSGAECSDDVECKSEGKSGAFCGLNDTCAATLGEGEACALRGCADGLFCAFETLTCQPQQESGDCSLQFDACSADTACSPNAVCEPKLADGAACLLSLQCESGACSADGRCVGTFMDRALCSG